MILSGVFVNISLVNLDFPTEFKASYIFWGSEKTEETKWIYDVCSSFKTDYSFGKTFVSQIHLNKPIGLLLVVIYRFSFFVYGCNMKFNSKNVNLIKFY